MNKKPWLIYAIITTITWGIWGAVMEFPAKWGFPETLGYITWSLTMIPCAIVALWFANWRLEYDRRSIFLGSMIGLLGAGGQLILFMALREGPAYIILLILKEKVKGRGQLAIALALGAILLLSYTPPSESQSAGYLWLVLATLVFVMWGLQAFVMKFSNNVMQAESIFFYMALTSVLLAPVAYAMTDFSKPIEWGLKGPYVSALIQVLNSIGALFLVYAIRYGKAIIVVPMTSLAPVITIILSLAIYGVMPNPVVIVGMVLASIAIYLLSLE
jgi:drug/metabolite transporter (DMT)-like permease